MYSMFSLFILEGNKGSPVQSPQYQGVPFYLAPSVSVSVPLFRSPLFLSNNMVGDVNPALPIIRNRP